MSRKTVTAILGGAKIEIPIANDKESTLKAVERVNRHLKEIEKKSRRIDTQTFALLAAVAFAEEVEQIEADESAADAEIANALGNIADTLGEIVEEFDTPE